MHVQNASYVAAPTLVSGDSNADGGAHFVQCMATAAATVACADGRLHPAERSELVGYARRFLSRGAARRWDVLAMFDEKMRRLQRDSRQRAQFLQELHVLAGTPRAWMALRAAELVAAADGDVGEAEIAALTSIRRSLGISSGIRERFAACTLWGFPAPGGSPRHPAI
jgi:tellurite resistance protein